MFFFFFFLWIDCSCHIFLCSSIHTVVMAADKRAAFWKSGKRAGGGGAWPIEWYAGGGGENVLPGWDWLCGGVVVGVGVVFWHGSGGADAAIVADDEPADVRDTGCCCDGGASVDGCSTPESPFPPDDACAKPLTRRLSAVLNNDPNWSYITKSQNSYFSI